MDVGIFMGSTILFTIVIVVCTSLPFVLIAGLLIFSARRSQKQVINSQNWPFVMGEVASSHIEARRTTDSEGHSSTNYYPRIVYEYEVRGHRYQSDQVSFGGSVGTGASGDAQSVSDRYIPGNRIRVYYNPNNPGEAVLERSAGSSPKILIWVAAFIFATLLCTTISILAFTIIPILGIGGFLENLPITIP